MKRGVVLTVLVVAVLGVAPAVSARPGFVETPTVAVADSDGDGFAEVSVTGVAGGPCACWCPILRGQGQAVMIGQAVGADSRSAVVLCGTRAVTTVDPNPPDPGQAPDVNGRWEFNPGGFGPRLPRR